MNVVKETDTQRELRPNCHCGHPQGCAFQGAAPEASHCEGEIDFTRVTRPAAKHEKAKSTCKGDQ